MKGKGLLPLAAIGVLAYMAANNKTADELTQADVATLGFTGSGNSTVDEVIQAIKNSSSLRTILKGDKGDTGTAGATGAIGPTGESIQNFGYSLLRNGALEAGTLQHWVGDAITIGEVYEGLVSLLFTSAIAWHTQNDTVVDIDNRRLYKATCFAKTTSGYRIFLRRMDKGATDIIQGGSPWVYGIGSPSFTNTSFEKKVVYFGGIDNTITASFGLTAAKTKLSVYANSAGTVTINKLSFELVPLAEPVPYNLAYLPDGQMVYDTTTGKIGRYNGSTIVWNG